MCTDKLKTLPCNKDKSDVELADFSKVIKKQVTMAVVRESVLTTSQNNEHTALPTAVAHIIVKDFLVNVNILFDQGSQVTLVSKDFVNKFNSKSNGSKEMQICGVTGEGISRIHKTYPININTNEGIVNITAVCYESLP